MADLDPNLLTLLNLTVSCLFVVAFGALGFLRREGLSVQFALEAVGVAAILVGGSGLLGAPINPVLLVALLFLITRRSWLIVDLASVLAQRGNYAWAFRLYRLGMACWPDEAALLYAQTNKGAALLLCGQVEEAIAIMEGVLEIEKRPRLGLKSEAGCRYNLAHAYEKIGQDAQAVAQYNETIDLLPGSVYGRAAQAALKRRKEKRSEAE